MPKRVVITADDFGASETSNEKIMKCRAENAVTDMSLLAVGNSFQHAVRLAKENNISKIGAHLALTGEFKPLTSARFHKGYIAFFVRYFAGCLKNKEIYAEFKEQIARIKNEGFIITHLNSHHHVHMVPGILKTVIRLAEEEKVGFIRLTRANGGIFRILKDPHGFMRDIMIYPMSVISGRLMDKNNIKHNDYFCGYTRALRLRKKDFLAALKNVKEGLTELGCHPGERSDEADILCDKSFMDEIKARNIELASY